MLNRKKSEVEKVVAPLLKVLESVCDRVEFNGDMLRGFSHIRQISFLAVPRYDRRRQENLLDAKLKLLQKTGDLEKVDGKRSLYRWVSGQFEFCLTQASKEAWVSMMFQSSCEKDLFITVATAAKAFGKKWVPASGGFVFPSGKVRVVKSEEEIFETVGLPYMPPKLRNYGPVFKDDGKKLPVFESKDEVRAWERSKTWVDTWCGGEHHNYCFRTQGARQTPQQAETEFLRMIWTIRKYGYDGRYYGRLWRYLDLDGVRFFDNGWNPVSTWVLNRKPHIGRPAEWKVNPVKWVDQGNDSFRSRVVW